MATRRLNSEKILPILDPLGRRRRSKLSRGKTIESEPQRSILKPYARKFQVVGGGGAYGHQHTSLNPSSQSLRMLTPELPSTVTNRSTTSLHHSSAKRLSLQKKPASLPRGPLLRNRSGSAAVRPKHDFSPEYFRELGNMLRLQVKQGEAEETRGCRSIETQATRWTVGRKLASLVTCSQWQDRK